MKFSSAFIVLSSVLAALAATPAQVVTDLGGINSQTQTLDTNIKAITTTNIAGALAVHTAAGNLVTAINSATTDASSVTPSPVSETDGASILSAVQTLEPTIINTLSDLVAKKATIAAIPINGLIALVLQDLKNLNTATTALEGALLKLAPADLVPQSQTIVSAINNGLSSAIAAYSS
ncbi:hydrophobic surface binding protein A-domain-containing protein [Panaeolus papilionaceus]|nr:hydrophobic surface binding protein A-domain-containing protein [Panaeolus papilionaceus]